jgi:hypothetical protein
MAQFPKNGAPMSFDKICDPLVTAMRTAFNLTRKNEGKDIPWRGPEFGAKDLTVNMPVREKLSSANMQEHDDDPLEVIIAVAVLLGIEQGRRLATEEAKHQKLMAEMKSLVS